MPIDLRILVVSAATIYLGAVYIYFSVYLGGVFVYPPIYLKSVIWTAMMQTMFTVLLAVLEFKKVRAVVVWCKLLLQLAIADAILWTACTRLPGHPWFITQASRSKVHC